MFQSGAMPFIDPETQEVRHFYLQVEPDGSDLHVITEQAKNDLDNKRNAETGGVPTPKPVVDEADGEA